MPKLNDELAAELALLSDALTPVQVAELLEVHRTTVYRLIATGDLRAVGRGSRGRRRNGLKIPQASLLAYLRGDCEPAA